MSTAGLSDDSREVAVSHRTAGQGGVGGGIIAVSPGKFGMPWSPPLDEAGNSIRAQKSIADISNNLGGIPMYPGR
jgi:glutaminase